MAEAFSKTFEDFEQEWIELGKEFEVVFDSGNSPQDLDSSDDEEQLKRGIKRKLSETEDSIVLTQRKMAIRGFTQQRSQEDPLLSTIRKENPAKYWALEERSIQPALPVFKPTLAGTVYSPVSPAFNTESPETTESTWKSPALPEFKPMLAETVFRPVSPVRTTESTEFRQTSPELNPVSYHTLTPLQWPFTTQATSSGSTQTTTLVEECAHYPLREELRALCELVESIRTDFLQTSMIVRYIQDYLRKYK